MKNSYKKYLKYKNKYLALKKLYGGSAESTILQTDKSTSAPILQTGESTSAPILQTGKSKSVNPSHKSKKFDSSRFNLIYDIPELEYTKEMSLEELLQDFKKNNSFFNIEVLKNNAFELIYKKELPHVIGIKYDDAKNRVWRYKWAREARGRFYYIGDDKVISLKDSLQRGIEILTKVHTTAGINETQDVTNTNLQSLDAIQQNILDKFSCENHPINSYITSKVDGSLLIINVYPINSEQYSVIMKIDNDLTLLELDELDIYFKKDYSFTHTIIKYCIENKLPIITVSSQGTLFLSSDMHEYFLTSIQPLIDINISSIENWIDIIPIFVKKVLDYIGFIKLERFDNNQMTNLCFESYCKNRTTFGGKVHTELAVGYDHNGLNLLGLFNKGVYIPHFDLPRYIFTQPFYLHIHETAEVFRLMNELDEVVLGNYTEKKLLSNFKLDEFTSRVVHPEGFVLLTPINGIYDYAKIKTKIYYKCHKIHKENIDELLKLPEETFKYFPILKTLHALFDPVNMITMKELIADIYKSLLEEINTEFNTKSNFYKTRIRIRPYIDDIINKIDLSIYSDDRSKLSEVYNTIINLGDNIKKQFGVIANIFYQNNSIAMINFLINLIMDIKPWYKNWEERLSTLFTLFPSIYVALLELERRNPQNLKNQNNQSQNNKESKIKSLVIEFQRLEEME